MSAKIKVRLVYEVELEAEGLSERAEAFWAATEELSIELALGTELDSRRAVFKEVIIE